MNLLAQTTQPADSVFKLSPILLSILGTVGSMVISDLMGYSAARKEWDAAGRKGDAPLFDFTLFATRIVVGLMTGISTGLGINVVNGQ